MRVRTPEQYKKKLYRRRHSIKYLMSRRNDIAHRKLPIAAFLMGCWKRLQEVVCKQMQQFEQMWRENVNDDL